MQYGRVQFGSQACVIGQTVKIGGEHDLKLYALIDTGKCLAVCILDIVSNISIEERLINLHVLGTQLLKLLEDIDICRQQSVKQFYSIKAALLLLTQKQIGDRANQHRLCLYAQRKSLTEIGRSLVVCERKLLVTGKLRYDIVVIGVKPFGHLHCRHVNAILLIAVSHGKIEFKPVILKSIVTFRDCTKRESKIQCLVIE